MYVITYIDLTGFSFENEVGVNYTFFPDGDIISYVFLCLKNKPYSKGLHDTAFSYFVQILWQPPKGKPVAYFSKKR
jgi:hypothetical protein